MDEGDDDPREESETPDDMWRFRLKDVTALGFIVGNKAVDDMEDEIDVKGDGA